MTTRPRTFARTSARTCVAALASMAMLSPGAAVAQETFDCLVDPSLVVQIGSAEAGIIDQIMVGRGDQVAKDQVIATLESGAEEAALEYARARAEDNAPVEIAESRAKLLLAEVTRARQLGQKNLMAEAAVAKVVSDYEQSLLAVRQAEIEKSLAQLDLKRVQAQLQRREILSPVDGLLITRMIGPGEYVFAQAPVAQIAQIDPLNVEVFLPTDLYGQVKLGDQATILPTQPVGGEYRAKVIVIDRIFDAASDTFGMRLQMPNPDGKLPAGMDCKIRFD